MKIYSFVQGSLFLVGLLATLLSACGGSGGTGSPTGLVADRTAPTVSATNPSSNVGNASVLSSITVAFSEAMVESTVLPNFTVFSGASSVSGSVSLNGTTATFIPSSHLPYSTTFTAAISGVQDTSGNAIAAPYTWTFGTQAPPFNDTGITNSQCYQAASNVLADCGSAAAIALYPAQDGMIGRDATAATNISNDGKRGFSFSAVTGGCVQDNVTGLMWEVKTNDGGLRDWTKTYTNFTAEYDIWFHGAAVSYGTSTDVSGFVTAVNATKLCGFDDWRLPTVDELQSIVDYGVVAPGLSNATIDANWFPNTQGGSYFSATPGRIDPYAWVVNFNDGLCIIDDREASLYVRLVRGTQTKVLPRYTLSADGYEVTDHQTNLIWQRCAEGLGWNGLTCAGTELTFTHELAMAHAKDMADFTTKPWRLPNVKELSSITNRAYFVPSIDGAFFPATPPGMFWSTSPYVGNPEFAWKVSFADGMVSGIINGQGSRSSNYYVRLVRDGP